MGTLTLNYTYRIYPDNKQEAMLSEWLEICRRSYNYALRELKDWISSRKCLVDRCSLESEYIMAASYPFPGYHQQQNQLPKAKKVYPELAKVQINLHRPIPDGFVIKQVRVIKKAKGWFA